jgi:hypothetical protein
MRVLRFEKWYVLASRKFAFFSAAAVANSTSFVDAGET